MDWYMMIVTASVIFFNLVAIFFYYIGFFNSSDVKENYIILFGFLISVIIEITIIIMFL